MKNLGVSSKAFLLAVALSACAHHPDYPKKDRSSGLDLAPLAQRFSVPRCTVSVPLTKEQVLRAAKLQGDPSPEDRTDWAAIVEAIEPEDDLRMVTCLKSVNGLAAGDVFFGLFRSGKMVAEMHNVIIN